MDAAGASAPSGSVLRMQSGPATKDASQLGPGVFVCDHIT